MGHQMNEFQAMQADIVDQTRMKVNTYQDEINMRNTEIRKLGIIIGNKENQLSQTTVANTINSSKVQEHEISISKKDREIEMLKQELESAKQTIDRLKQEK